ncbi:hypothetical protein BaRGS_00016949, partial [Batillaria attramentaria]
MSSPSFHLKHTDRITVVFLCVGVNLEREELLREKVLGNTRTQQVRFESTSIVYA